MTLLCLIVPNTIDAERLTLAMEKAGIGPAELARRIRAADPGNKTTTEYIVHIAAGRRRLGRSPHMRRQIANALGVPVDWIEGTYPRKVAS